MKRGDAVVGILLCIYVVSVCVSVCMSVCICMYACMYVCLCVSVCVSLSVCICVSLSLCVYCVRTSAARAALDFFLARQFFRISHYSFILHYYWIQPASLIHSTPNNNEVIFLSISMYETLQQEDAFHPLHPSESRSDILKYLILFYCLTHHGCHTTTDKKNNII